MKAFKILDRIFEIITPIIFLAYGITVIVFSGYDFVANNYQLILGILLMIGAVASVVDYIGGHKIRHEFNFDIVFAVLNLVLGIIVIAKNIPLQTICIIWGILEILKGAFEMQHLVIELKEKHYLAFVEVACATLDIVFGTLLCIHTEEDIMVHLIVVGIVFILTAAKQIVETIIEHKKEKTEWEETSF